MVWNVTVLCRVRCFPRCHEAQLRTGHTVETALLFRCALMCSLGPFDSEPKTVRRIEREGGQNEGEDLVGQQFRGP